jgi:alanyl-tRNA synthetase
MRELADQLRDKLDPAVIVLGTATEDNKAMLVCTVSKSLNKTWQAGKLIKSVAKIVGGGGGGRPDFAQAGGTDASKIDQALEAIYEIIENG